MHPGLILAAGGVCAVLWMALPRSRGSSPVYSRQGSSGGWVLGAVLVGAGIVAALTLKSRPAVRAAVAKAVPKPAPARTQVIVREVTRYVPGHPALSGTNIVLLAVAACAALVACVAIIGRRWGR